MNMHIQCLEPKEEQYMKNLFRLLTLCLALLSFTAGPVLAAPEQAVTDRGRLAVADALVKQAQQKSVQAKGRITLESVLMNAIVDFKAEVAQEPQSAGKVTGKITLTTVADEKKRVVPLNLYVMQEGKELWSYAQREDGSWVRAVTEDEAFGKESVITREEALEKLQTVTPVRDDGNLATYQVILTKKGVTEQAIPKSIPKLGTLTPEQRQAIAKALDEQAYTVTINQKGLPVSCEADATRCLQTLLDVAIDQAAKEQNLTGMQKEFAKAIMQTVQLRFQADLTYKKRKAPKVPKAALIARIVKQEQPGDEVIIHSDKPSGKAA